MISIIIPTLNEEKYLADTLQAIRRGMGAMPCEVIVSDGKSTDATVAIAQKYSAQVIEYQGEKRQTIAQARNMGAAAAHGDYFVFLDADVIVPDAEVFFGRAVRLFSDNARLTALCVSLLVLPEHATRADRFFFFWINGFHYAMNNILHCGVMSGEFQMVHAAAFQAVGGYNEKLVTGEDYDLFRRLARMGETYMEKSLRVFHTARRAHRIGWPRLLFLWHINVMSVLLFKRSASKVWEPIR